MDKYTLDKSIEFLERKFKAKWVYEKYELKENVRSIITEEFLKNIDMENKITDEL